jgi:TrmH family RNA methyltransferase
LRLRLVLVEIEGAVNLGFIARLAENFSVDELYLVSPRASMEEALRYAARAGRRLEEAVIVDRLEDALAGATLKACTSAHASRGSDALRVAVSPWEFAERAMGESLVAVVMGRESTGLRRSELELCDILINIPTSERYRALNVSNAAAIILYEIYKKRLEGSWKPREPPEPQRVALLLKYVEDVARSVAGQRWSEIVRSFRNILARADVSREEANSLLFLFSRISRRLEGGR